MSGGGPRRASLLNLIPPRTELGHLGQLTAMTPYDDDSLSDEDANSLEKREYSKDPKSAYQTDYFDKRFGNIAHTEKLVQERNAKIKIGDAKHETHTFGVNLTIINPDGTSSSKKVNVKMDESYQPWVGDGQTKIDTISKQLSGGFGRSRNFVESNIFAVSRNAPSEKGNTLSVFKRQDSFNKRNAIDNVQSQGIDENNSTGRRKSHNELDVVPEESKLESSITGEKLRLMEMIARGLVKKMKREGTIDHLGLNLNSNLHKKGDSVLIFPRKSAPSKDVPPEPSEITQVQPQARRNKKRLTMTLDL